MQEMPPEANERREGRRTIAQMVVVGLIASALGIALALALDWFPAASSTQAGPIDTMWDVMMIASVPVFVIVAVIVGFSIATFRMRPGEESLDGPPIHGSTRLEIIWTAVPAVIVVALVAYAYVVLRDIEEAPAAGRERVVRVFGEQFAWTFEYQEGGKRFRSAQLYLPAGESVKFDVRSKDVIHDFWVPDFRMKIDAVPGITTSYRVTPKPSAIGPHQIVCAELCGLGHAYMRQTARVVSRADFVAWVAKVSAPAGGEQAGGGGVDAKALFTAGKQDTGATACGACHTLADAGSEAATGPNLDESLQGKDAAYIEESIVKPDAALTEGFGPGIMPPNYADTLSPAEVDALVKYLAEMTK